VKSTLLKIFQRSQSKKKEIKFVINKSSMIRLVLIMPFTQIWFESLFSILQSEVMLGLKDIDAIFRLNFGSKKTFSTQRQANLFTSKFIWQT